MSNKYSKTARKAAREQVENLKAREVDIVKGFLKAVNGWPLKDRALMAARILFARNGV
jgi:hypothetical protein